MGSRWEMERKKDPYYKRAKADDYRSRASYKLKQLDKKYKIIRKGDTVVDLGAAPGGWSQVAMEKVEEEGIVVAVDLNRIKPLDGENFYRIRGDFTDEDVQKKIKKLVGGHTKVLISDASPTLTGIKDIDHLRSIDLIESVINIGDNSNSTISSLFTIPFNFIKPTQRSEHTRISIRNIITIRILFKLLDLMLYFFKIIFNT